MRDHATEDYFAPRSEQGTLFDNRTQHLAEPPVTLPAEKISAAPIVDNWPAQAAEIAQEHAQRAKLWDEPPCECGACRLTKQGGRV